MVIVRDLIITCLRFCENINEVSRLYLSFCCAHLFRFSWIVFATVGPPQSSFECRSLRGALLRIGHCRKASTSPFWLRRWNEFWIQLNVFEFTLQDPCRFRAKSGKKLFGDLGDSFAFLLVPSSQEPRTKLPFGVFATKSRKYMCRSLPHSEKLIFGRRTYGKSVPKWTQSSGSNCTFHRHRWNVSILTLR